VSDRSFALAGYPGRDDYDHRGVEHGLVGRHADLGCADCHVAADRPFLTPGETRFTGLDPACAICHDDPHRGTFGRRCESCHDQLVPFEEARFDHRFPIDRGAHRGLRCVDCHRSSRDVRDFSCVDCHEHRREEMDHEHRKVRRYVHESRSCYRCHPTGEEGDDD
jgi:hypothetical protein